MVPQDWRRIAQDIAQSHNQFDGFVVIMGHGHDGVLRVGPEFHAGRPVEARRADGEHIPWPVSYSDARRNLVMALIFAHAGPSEVVVFFGDRLLRGNRTTKVDALALSAYDSPNFPPLASWWCRTQSKVRPGVGAFLGTKMQSVHADGDEDPGFSHGARLRRQKAYYAASSPTNCGPSCWSCMDGHGAGAARGGCLKALRGSTFTIFHVLARWRAPDTLVDPVAKKRGGVVLAAYGSW